MYSSYIVIDKIINYNRTILLLKYWWRCSLLQAKKQFEQLLSQGTCPDGLFYLPDPQGEIELNLGEIQAFEAIVAEHIICSQSFNYFIKKYEAEPEKNSTETVSYFEAKMWYRSLPQADQAKIDLLIKHKYSD